MLTIFLFFSSLLLLLMTAPPRLTWATTSLSMLLMASFFFFNYSSLPFQMISNSFYTDTLASIMITLTLWVSSLMLMASQPILTKFLSPQKFLFYVIALAFVLSYAFSFANALLFYILFEASLIPTLFLVLGWGYQPERLQAGMYLLMYTVTASLPLLLSLLFFLNSSFHLSFILPWWKPYFTPTIMSAWWLITILAFLVKTPLYFVHLWLPKAHVEAPVAGSMILAGILLKLGTYGLFRMSMKMMFYSKSICFIIFPVCLIGGVLTSFICIRQTDVKSLIAYSSVSHMGLATAGLMTNSTWGWQGAFSMLIAHGLCSSCMFALANISYETTQSRSMYVTKGMLALFPSMTFWWFSFSACNMAAPPSLNLASEIILISSSVAHYWGSILPLGLMAFMAAAYSLVLYTATQHGTPPSFQSSLHIFTPRNYSLCFIHFIPLVTIVSKMDIVSNWF
uniref:NADH-ubiquinone oxidoreductase chain 4 n=1 Tax=Prionospio multibranchiata TaxID=3050093 RepID=A0AAU6QG32_9ANNE